MEDLANRGFYRKEQIGKKFVYTPVPIKESEWFLRFISIFHFVIPYATIVILAKF